MLAVSRQPAKKPAARFETNFLNNFEVKLKNISLIQLMYEIYVTAGSPTVPGQPLIPDKKAGTVPVAKHLPILDSANR